MKKFLTLMGIFLVVSLGIAACGGNNTQEDSSKTKESSNQTDKQMVTLALDKTEVSTDIDGFFTISGQATPNALVSIEDDLIQADDKGHFEIKHSLNPDIDKYDVMVSKDGWASRNGYVTVTASKEYLAKQKADEAAKKIEDEKRAKENALAAEKAAKEEAARKAEEERIAQKEAAAEKERQRLGAEGESAIIKAEAYGMTMNMSRAGIYDQLTSEYGEKFSEDAAQYALNNIEIDYKANALAKAKDYQAMMAMSPEAIRDQLTSEYGEKFTSEEADYAIQHLNN
ncbi:Ltp family lipoprotein [Listeria booriae]|uniref:Ltp family lipoprotein n=1 Tax=Listeria booriae TaxID=1552123 RepID=UPI0028803B49|nr:Ltp family lipoprotein [Listeria booriae]MDT0111952.1 Ltp family lipoprotein [Listeria booriae]